ncbi:integrase, catalytic region, zinc finger, CCHC-type containing protein [Tanacetum coccineum]
MPLQLAGQSLGAIQRKNRTLPAKSDKKKVEDHSRYNKSSVKQKNRVDSSISYKRIVINSNSNHVCKTCNKCLMSFNHDKCVVKSLKFVKKPPVNQPTGRKFTLGEQCPLTRFSVRQFCDSDLEVTFRKYFCYVRDVNGVGLIKGNHSTNLYTISVEDMMKSSPICLLSKASKNKSWLCHRRLNHLNFGTINDLSRKDLVRGLPRYIRIDNGTEFVNQFLTEYYESVGIFTKNQFRGLHSRMANRTLMEAVGTMLIFSKALMFLWTEAVATACYTQNRSLIHTRHNKTPYELVHDRKPDLKFLYVFGALCYPTNDSEDLGKLRTTADIGIFLTEPMAPVHSSTGPEPILLTPGRISSGLVPDPFLAATYAPPTNKDLEILFQPMSDEYFEPPGVERPVPPTPAVQVPVASAGTPSSTTIDQDAPSTSYSPSSSVVQPPISHQDVAAGPTIEDNPFAQADNDLFVNVFAPEPSSNESSSGMTILLNLHKLFTHTIILENGPRITHWIM